MLKQVAAQSLSALDYLHNTLNLVHLDIKPANIMIEINPSDIPRIFRLGENQQSSEMERPKKNNYLPFLNVKLIDLNGAVKMVPGASRHWNTEAYAAPETSVKGGIHFKSDVFSLGMTVSFQ